MDQFVNHSVMSCGLKLKLKLLDTESSVVKLLREKCRHRLVCFFAQNSVYIDIRSQTVSVDIDIEFHRAIRVLPFFNAHAVYFDI